MTLSGTQSFTEVLYILSKIAYYKDISGHRRTDRQTDWRTDTTNCLTPRATVCAAVGYILMITVLNYSCHLRTSKVQVFWVLTEVTVLVVLACTSLWPSCMWCETLHCWYPQISSCGKLLCHFHLGSPKGDLKIHTETKKYVWRKTVERKMKIPRTPCGLHSNQENSGACTCFWIGSHYMHCMRFRLIVLFSGIPDRRPW